MNVSPPVSIGVIARQAGCTVPTIRYYEEIGLVPPAPRSESGQRNYGPAALRRLTFIRRCRDFGFSIEQVRELVGLVDAPDRPCAEARAIAAAHLNEVRKKLGELQALRDNLARFVASCDTACAGGAIADCTILEDLGMPAEQTRPVNTGACCRT
jgi:MerR family copper efflux transcriptional regulator